MKVPKEIADMVEIYEAGNKAFNEIVAWLKEKTAADGVFIEDVFIVDEPTGRKQNDGEYCDQHSVGDCGDSFEGHYYHPIEGSSRYLGYRFEC